MPDHLPPRRVLPTLGAVLALVVLAGALVSAAIGHAAVHHRHGPRKACRRVVHSNVVHDTCDTETLDGASLWRFDGEPIVAVERQLLREHDWAEAAQVNRIASLPIATWFVGGVSRRTVRHMTRDARKQGKVPVYVLYDLPWRGCGQPGAGGAPSPRAYRRAVRAFAAGIGGSEVMVVVEPDALSEIPCLSRSRRVAYYSLLRYAVARLSRDPRARLYVDAGHPQWVKPRTIARRLMKVARSTNIGFALNVSNYYPTGMDDAYGAKVSKYTGGKHFVIDTSRNGGAVRLGVWCNPSGARIGSPPSTDTGNPLVDAYLWVKPPGESDGTCNGGPPAGVLWMASVLALTSDSP